jgi:NAD(P)-dependent dehydrogenase (short-subunit alcohol dehydrogenase family)
MATILITGSNRGIGLELTRQFILDDWQVHACCRHPEQADELKALQRTSSRLSIHKLDVSNSLQIKTLATKLKAEAIDILVNNAGLFGPRPANLELTDVKGWLETYRVNSVAPMQMALAFAEQLARSDQRVLATMGTSMGCVSQNTVGSDYAYRASKAATHMVVKGLSVDLAKRGIACVLLHPGWVHTSMGGPKAPVSPLKSAIGLHRVLTGLSYKDNGKFYDYCGQERDW